ncbi:hypothetical protein [Nostoc sp.]|uniref:hypothetical protein n=1 Tax=Nostoc sp. TaxID=1180 RepID=UPI002FFB7171
MGEDRAALSLWFVIYFLEMPKAIALLCDRNYKAILVVGCVSAKVKDNRVAT